MRPPVNRIEHGGLAGAGQRKPAEPVPTPQGGLLVRETLLTDNGARLFLVDTPAGNVPVAIKTCTVQRFCRLVFVRDWKSEMVRNRGRCRKSGATVSHSGFAVILPP